MSRIDHEKLAALEGEFREHPGGIELPNFVWLLKCSIGHSEQEEFRLIDGLIKLFSDIDINGDKHIEWHEFTQYIIDAVVADDDKNKKNDGDAGDGGAGKDLMLQEAYNKALKSYKIKFDLTDRENFKQHVCKIIYCPKFHCYAVREEHCDKLKILGEDLCMKQSLDLPRLESTLFNHLTVSVTDFALNPSLGFVLLNVILDWLSFER